MVKRVALLDAGAQLERVIMRRIIELGYDVDKFPADVSAEKIKEYDAIIISGGPRSVLQKDSIKPDVGIYSLGLPILGICYGIQSIAHQLGGRVVSERGQYGRKKMCIAKNSGLFYGLENEQLVLMSHFDNVANPPPGFEITAMSDGLVAAMQDKKRRIYGVQFHPEMVPNTKHGKEMFANFFHKICRFEKKKGRTIGDYKRDAQRIMGERLGSDKHIMIYLSGGVDSTVLSMLAKETIEPERQHNILLDTGFMREGEIGEVEKRAQYLGLPNFTVLNVENVFSKSCGYIKLKNKMIYAGPLWAATDPEIKRKLFTSAYAAIAIERMHDISNTKRIPAKKVLLGQGTLRPDVIESGDKRASKGGADTIKSHHNVGGPMDEIEKVEPLIELFKDQVRELGIYMGLPEDVAYRQPFPGPGLLTRMIGLDRYPDKAELERIVDIDYRIRKSASEHCFSGHILPIKTVGVQGDERSYKYAAILCGEMYPPHYEKAVLNMPDEIKDINRVLWMPGGPVSLQDCLDLRVPTYAHYHYNVGVAKRADAVMREIAGEYGYNDSRKMSQMPGILVPCGFGTGEYSFVVRTALTPDFMALIGMNFYIKESDIPVGMQDEYIPLEMAERMAKEIPERVGEIERVIFDNNGKPPSSTEWE